MGLASGLPRLPDQRRRTAGLRDPALRLLTRSRSQALEGFVRLPTDDAPCVRNHDCTWFPARALGRSWRRNGMLPPSGTLHFTISIGSAMRY
ncbi:hypothetical protein DDF84_029675 [Cupriavidus metallidurans]|uniref:Uncharacterized protein n=1 Tax=Cupriavidus metallidurans TaxID=119219 RepID=A0A482J2B3_9BURK|nr:hypothetical protein DDF84_029675 [Cupriavidus metallidurans]